MKASINRIIARIIIVLITLSAIALTSIAMRGPMMSKVKETAGFAVYELTGLVMVISWGIIIFMILKKIGIFFYRAKNSELM